MTWIFISMYSHFLKAWKKHLLFGDTQMKHRAKTKLHSAACIFISFSNNVSCYLQCFSKPFKLHRRKPQNQQFHAFNRMLCSIKLHTTAAKCLSKFRQYFLKKSFYNTYREKIKNKIAFDWFYHWCLDCVCLPNPHFNPWIKKNLKPVQSDRLESRMGSQNAV